MNFETANAAITSMIDTESDAIRDIMIAECDPAALPDDIDHPEELINAIGFLFAERTAIDPRPRELLTALALDNSLCPLHFDDYAACFDDENPECAAIRAIHPNHDT